MPTPETSCGTCIARSEARSICNWRFVRAGWVLIGLALSCERGHREATPATPQPSQAAPAMKPTSCTLAPHPVRLPRPQRAVAIGDLHGDLAGARAALRAAGAIDDRDAWIGGGLVVVQLGDVLDRGDEESQILEWFDRLDTDARAVGGAVIQLLGNHELMNAAHDFRYVTRGGAGDFGGDREHALAPGGPWAKRLAQHDTIAMIGDTILSHAGIVGDWAANIDEVNLTTRCWLDGQAGSQTEPPPVLVRQDSPLWTRVWGSGTVDCERLGQVLHRVGANRMVVAHTVQEHGITSACDEKLWRIDVGLAKLYGGPIEVLELGDPPHVRRGER